MALRTPLYEWHRAAGARLIEFGGWDMPLQYTGIVEEHLAVRRAVGLFDVSHMGKLVIAGPSAYAFLDRLSSNDLPTTPGRARYTHLLREDGTIIDDVIVTTLGPDRLFMVCNAGPRPTVLAWLESHRPAGVRITDCTLDHLCIAVQGPKAPGLLQRLTSVDLASLKPFRGAVIDFHPGAAAKGGPVETEGWGSPESDPLMAASQGLAPTAASGGRGMLLTRTGYTGEPGFELFPAAVPGLAVWGSLMATGADLGVMPIGLGARDTLRLEKGYLLSGQDFDGRQTPLEVGCAWVVKFGRAFVGHEALEAQRTRDDYPRFVGLRMEDRGIPRHGCRVLSDDREVGRVTSGTMSPSLRIGIALGPVTKEAAEPGTSLQVDIRGTVHPAAVVHPPFL